VVAAARGLLGTRLVRTTAGVSRIGLIVDVEAYGGPEDRASHARFGRTRRTASMFGRSGLAYVYRVYGMHTCLNVVTGPEGAATAVLLRAVHPLAGLAEMREARLRRTTETRRVDREDPAGAALRIGRQEPLRLAGGPANLAAAFDVDEGDDGIDLLDPGGSLRLVPRPAGEQPPVAVASSRVGVSYAGAGWADRPWRFVARTAGPGLDGA
jgi:DNA-3-methyladenine glycosylase